MKTLFKLFLPTFLMTLVLSSCGTTYQCMEGNEGREDQVPSETGFKNEVPVEDVKEKWIPAAERTTNNEVETTTGLASEDVDENLTFEEDKEAETVSKNGKHKRSRFKNAEKGRVKNIINTLKEHKKNKKKRNDGAMLVLLVILAIILPPLAVGIYEGITGRFWLVLLLWLLGLGLGIWLLGFGLGWLCGLVAVILALLIVLGVL